MSQNDIIYQWLSSFSLERYAPKFQEAGLDSVDLLKHLKRRDLVKFGITAVFHQDLILREASRFAPKNNSNFLRLRLTSVDNRSTRVVLPQDTTVEALKRRIERDWLGVESEYLKISYQGTIFGDDEEDNAKTLKELNVVDDSTLLVLSTRPPPVETPFFIPSHPFFFLPRSSTNSQPQANNSNVCGYFDLQPVLPTISFFHFPLLQRPNAQTTAPSTSSSSLSPSTAPSYDKLCQKMKDLEVCDEENENKMETITVQFISDMKEIQIEQVQPNLLTIGQLKAQLSCLAGPVDNQLIILNCRICDDDEATLSSFGFNPSKDKVYVVIRQQDVNPNDDVELELEHEY